VGRLIYVRKCFSLTEEQLQRGEVSGVCWRC